MISRDVVFWIDLLRADAANLAAVLPDECPDNVKRWRRQT